MLKTPMPTQHELEMVTLEELVPKDHLLRQIDAAVDFEFIRAKVAHLYCADNGRPALDPVVMFKLLFIGYLFGVRSERQLMREVQVNVAYRWFARFRLTDKVPDASTFSQNRRRRFTDTTVYQEIFDEIVRQAIKRGLRDLLAAHLEMRFDIRRRHHPRATIVAAFLAAAFRHSRQSVGEGATAAAAAAADPPGEPPSPRSPAPTSSIVPVPCDAINSAPQAVRMPSTAVSRSPIVCG
ncbi:transposase [Burkholderia pseudomallei]|nr:transposase [Burkholderia pseudomallei]